MICAVVSEKAKMLLAMIVNLNGKYRSQPPYLNKLETMSCGDSPNQI